jgi:hypothetical protein
MSMSGCGKHFFAAPAANKNPTALGAENEEFV